MKCDTVVIHATETATLEDAIEVLRDRRLSYHYIINKKGQIYQCAPNQSVCFHAGKSYGPQGVQVNEYSVGVSLVNKNNGKDSYPKAQIQSLKWLMKQLKSTIPELQYLTTHYWIAPGRKNDPMGLPIEPLAVEVDLVLWKPENGDLAELEAE